MRNRHASAFRKIVFLFLFSTVSCMLSGQFTQKRILERTLHAGRETTLEVINKYGTIEVTIWNSDSVAIRAEIEAHASTRDRTDKMLKGVSVDISSTKNLVRARSEFEPSPGMLLESFKGMTDRVIAYDSRIQVNYYMKVPPYISLRLDNKYGDIIIESIKGDLAVTLSNGSLKAGDAEGSCELNLNFSNAALGKVANCRIDAAFSELAINEAGKMFINSISSRYEIGNATDLTTESRRDKFFIGTAGSFKGSTYFSQVRIDRLTGEADLKAKYGNLTMVKIDNSFDRIKINSGYNDINLTFGPAVSYNLSMKYANTSVSLPTDETFLDKESVSEERKEYKITGRVGRAPGKKQVEIEASRGTVTLR